VLWGWCWLGDDVFGGSVRQALVIHKHKVLYGDRLAEARTLPVVSRLFIRMVRCVRFVVGWLCGLGKRGM